MTAPRILIVDDEDNHRRTLAIGLRLEGFEVIEARTAKRLSTSSSTTPRASPSST